VTIPPIRADASVLRPNRQPPSAGPAAAAAVEVKALPALSGLLSHSLDVCDLCKTASLQAGSVAHPQTGLHLGDRRRRQLELIVSLLEPVPVLVGGAVALAEVMTGNNPIPETTPGSNADPPTVAA
jgi:hypothetical protein